MRKPPKTTVIAWSISVAWIWLFSHLLDEEEIYTETLIIHSVNCDYRESKNRSYLNINNNHVTTTLPKTKCSTIMPHLKEGVSITIQGPKRTSGSIVTYGLISNGVVIKDTKESQEAYKSIFYFLGLGLPAVIFLASLNWWRKSNVSK